MRRHSHESFVASELPRQSVSGQGEAKAAALLQLGVSVASWSPEFCLEWSTARTPAASATAPGLGRVVCAAAVATALRYDITATLEDPDHH
jgi:hypothetical protein